MPTSAELLARVLATQPPNYADEKARLGEMIGPNEGDMAAVAETDPTTWQGRLRGAGLGDFVAPYEALAPAPDTTYGTLLPIAHDNASGDLRLALPTMARDVATGWLDMLTGLKTGEITPAASAALQATGLPMASPSGSLASGGALRQFQAATPYAAKTAAQKASIEAGRQAWMWKTPAGKFVVNAGKQPEGAKLVGRAVGDEWFSGPGLMAKAGSKETAAAEAAGKSLPMDEASRMARAKAMGFDTDAYHATTDADIKAFKSRGFVGKNTDANATDKACAQTSRLGHWFSDHDITRETGANTLYPVKLKMSNPYYSSLYGLIEEIRLRGSGAQLKSSLMKDGFDGIVVDDTEFGGKSYVVFKPNQIRSRFAAFDPAKADSADLLAARTGTPELLTALLQQRQPPRDDVNATWLNSGGL